MNGAIAVTGATGNVGHEIVRRLLAEGRKVIAIARTPSTLAALVAKGAEARPASLDDAASMKGALRGATAVFAMIPPNRANHNQDQFARTIAENITAAISDSDVKSVVALSSCGIDIGTESNHRIFEEVFDGVPGLNRVHLRPGLFMDFFLRQIDLIKKEGRNRGYLSPTLPIPMVSALDIGAVAAEYLARLDWTGRTLRYVLGPMDLTMPEATRILGDAVGKPGLEYVPYTEAEARARMTTQGFSQDYVDHYVVTRNRYNATGRASNQERSAENTTPTPLQDFAKSIFAPAFSKTE